jgi:D-erythro-7,8-dihydroneopterin triphosphate epimerase
MSDGLDRIYIRDLLCRCIVGIYPEERQNMQDVLVNIVLYADLRIACHSDRIEDTVDYKRIKKDVVATIEASSFFLVERLADQIASVCLERERIQRVEVTVDKPGALRFARSVAVHIVRERASHE